MTTARDLAPAGHDVGGQPLTPAVDPWLVTEGGRP